MGFWQACEDTWLRQVRTDSSFMVLPDGSGLDENARGLICPIRST